MKKMLETAANAVFTPGEVEALRNLFFEFRISHYHRQGMKKIRRLKWARPEKINLGCGDALKEGFLNVDIIPCGDLSLDLRRGLPFETECCDLIFSEHFFEHISYPETASRLLADCLRILRPGGVLRFSVPDTEWPLVDYAAGLSASYFEACRVNSWHPADCVTPLEHINYHFRQRQEHKYAYDEETATKLLKTIGFVNVHRGTFDRAIDSKHREAGSLIMVASKAR